MAGRKRITTRGREPSGRIARVKTDLPTPELAKKKLEAMGGRMDLELDDPMAVLHAHGKISAVAFSASASFARLYWKYYGRPFADTAKMEARDRIVGTPNIDRAGWASDVKRQNAAADVRHFKRHNVMWRQVIEPAAHSGQSMLHMSRTTQQLTQTRPRKRLTVDNLKSVWAPNERWNWYPNI